MSVPPTSSLPAPPAPRHEPGHLHGGRRGRRSTGARALLGATCAALTPEDGGDQDPLPPEGLTSSTRASRAPSPKSRLFDFTEELAPTPTSTATWSATSVVRVWVPCRGHQQLADRARTPAHLPRSRRRPVRAHPRRPAQLLGCHGRSSARVTRKPALPC